MYEILQTTINEKSKNYFKLQAKKRIKKKIKKYYKRQKFNNELQKQQLKNWFKFLLFFFSLHEFLVVLPKTINGGFMLLETVVFFHS